MLLAAGMPVGLAASSATGKASALLIVFNADPQPAEFRLPPSKLRWRCIFTTADAEPNVNRKGVAAIEARSVQLFELT
jgi:pullulanase/glycogen debranching enzyme